MRTAVIAILAVACCTTPAEAAESVEWMVKLTLDGRKIEGTPLAWSAEEVFLLGRDGRLWQFPPEEAGNYRQTSRRFRSYSPSEFRAQLLRDLGREFEVSGTGHYLVAHPRGQRDKWAPRFEELYRSFVHYFSVRGLKLAKPPFPLVGVVCRDRRDFYRFSAKQGMPITHGMLGYYLYGSNQIIICNVDNRADLDDWHRTASLIVHEATHQTAFNTGVHSRYTPPPIWVAEGLATMFEAPGVFDSRNHPSRSDRTNRGRLRTFRKLAPHHKPELPIALVGSDRLFQTNPGAAYAEAWAMTFYLVETQPREYTQYLELTAARPPFGEYTPAERMADFTSVFGDDWQMFEARFLRFMAEVD